MCKFEQAITALGLSRQWAGIDRWYLRTATTTTLVTKRAKGGHIQHSSLSDTNGDFYGWSKMPIFVKSYKSDAGFIKGLAKLAEYMAE